MYYILNCLVKLILFFYLNIFIAMTDIFLANLKGCFRIQLKIHQIIKVGKYFNLRPKLELE
ncbi:hypothetical protein ASG34_13720 [Methylophilus sp. Leaf416]|nr:hypothetical protein ASG34_13720 [Methylophilus sp. Leaf416]